MALLFVLALAQPAPAPAPAPAAAPPDIQLDIRATARRVVIENDGRVELRLHTAVNGREGEGNRVEVQGPQVPQGRTTLNNVEVRVRAEARIPDPLAASTEAEEEREPQKQR